MSNHNDKCVLNGETPQADNPVLNQNVSGIYMIYCSELDSAYIGRSSNLAGRLAEHIASLRAKRHKNKHLQSAYDANYELEITILELTQDLINAEQKHIDNCKFSLFNIAKSAKLGGKKSAEAELKKSESLKAYHRQNPDARTGKNNTFYGCQHKQEAKDLIGKKNSKPIMIKGIEYPSRKAACEALGISHPRYLKRFVNA